MECCCHRAWWIVIVLVISITALCEAELDRVFIHCCSLGRNFGRTSENCEDYSTPISGVQRQDQFWCGVALGVCCREEVAIGKCDDGKTAAQENLECTGDTGLPGGHEFKQCCDCCTLGLLAGSSGYGKQCDSASFQITNCNKLYKECCEFSKLRSGLFGNGSESLTPREGSTRPPRTTTRATTTMPTVPTTLDPTQTTPVGPSCPSGHEYHPGIGQCLDINECKRKTHTCPALQQCVNTVGSYKCEPDLPDAGQGTTRPEPAVTPRLCPSGYQNNPRTGRCEDIDECGANTDYCGSGMRCENEAGSFRCVREISCGTGYTYDAYRRDCTDNDECALGVHNCGTAYDCLNTQGSFRCTPKTCPKKMRLDYERGICNHVTCSLGMEAADDGTCVDINECNIPGNCKRNQDCFNTVGSHLCRDKLNCGAGHLLNEAGTRCDDIDECTDRTHNCFAGQRCENRPGTFECKCQDGFEPNFVRKQCDDINECLTFGRSACSASATCENFPGSYRCNCKDGFRHGSDGLTCEDIDECDQPNICHHGCINSWGSHNCTCRTGYRLASDGRTCEDIDECAENLSGPQLCFGECINNPGGYNCTCPSGFRMLPDNRRCEDIDECKEQLYCNRNDQICTNTEGGFNCNNIRCPPGYSQDADQKNRCRRLSLVCPIGDSYCLQQPISYSYNYMAIPTNPIFPNTGKIDLFTMRGPQQPTTKRPFMYGVQPADRRFFDTRTTGFNQATISLVRPLDGPQEIELEMQMP
ncbi:Fibulin-1 [Hypsibius exemplaris]|uniref:Fibulin-1 n=1 Tax=Hypsibius exemplaris TaxID=2072580 RepID=A0A1W0WUV6_HYPEX|nr:Fibulin-1 [Hypsibius exemplaris]